MSLQCYWAQQAVFYPFLVASPASGSLLNPRTSHIEQETAEII